MMKICLTMSIAAVMLVSAGCTPTTTAPTTAPPANPDATVETIYFDAEVVELRDGAGTALSSFDYQNDPIEVRDALAGAFGEPATEVPYEDGVLWQWAGVYLVDPTDDDTASPYLPKFLLWVELGTVAAVDIETVDGLHVGSTAAELEAVADDQFDDGSSGISGIVGLTLFSPEIQEELGADAGLYIEVIAPGDLVTRMIGPMPNFGP
jgi:hypothetical protein